MGAEQNERLRLSVQNNPAAYDNWSPRTMALTIGLVVDVDADGEHVALFVSGPRMVADAEARWRERHPDLAARYDAGPRARVIVE